VTLRHGTHAGAGGARTGDSAETIRLDRWLWQARFFKTRSLACSAIASGHVRVNGQRVSRPARAVRPGDALTFRFGDAVAVVRIRATGARRGPATEARMLYDLLEEPDNAGTKVAGVGKGTQSRLNDGEDRITSAMPQTGNPDP